MSGESGRKSGSPSEIKENKGHVKHRNEIIFIEICISVEIVTHFNLLGSELEDRGTCKMDLDRRLELGRAAMMGLTNI